jgi:hypothetical protein
MDADTAPQGKSPARQRGRWRKVLKRAGWTLLVLLVAGWWWFFVDASPPQDADLTMAPKPVPSSENVVPALLALNLKPLDFYAYAESKGHSLEDAGTIKDDPIQNATLVENFFAQAVPTLNAADRALQRPSLQFPPKFGEVTVAAEELFLPIAEAWGLRGHLDLEEGRYESGLDEAQRTFDLAARLDRSNVNLLGILVTLPIKGQGAYLCHQVMDDTRAPNAIVRRALGMLPPANESLRALGHALPAEYSYFKAKLLEPFSEEVAEMNLSLAEANRWIAPFRANGGIVLLPLGFPNWMPYYLYYTRLQPNRTLALLGADYREIDASLQSPVDALNNTAAAKNAHESFWRSLLRRNSGGRSTVDDVVLGVVATGHSIYQAECRWALLRAGLAARWYWDGRGVLPPSLAALVPEYLAEVPRDPFSGAALHYDVARGLIWSVGKSGKDEGGSKMLEGTGVQQVEDDPFLDDYQPTLVLKFAQPAAAPAVASKGAAAAGK